MKTEKLTELLNLSRSGSWTSDHTIQLAAAIKASSDVELRLALLHFAQGLARTSLTLKTCQLHAAISAEAIAERDAGDGLLQ